jgi:uncharacterized membrane protein YidH (DUF202 family)
MRGVAVEQLEPQDWQPDRDSMARGPQRTFLGAMIVLAVALVLFFVAAFFLFTHIVAPILHVLSQFGEL